MNKHPRFTTTTLLAAIAMLTPGATVHAGLADGLLLHWGFECVTGSTVCDQSGNGYTGTVQNGAAYVPPGAGRAGGGAAYRFDGIDDAITGANLGYVPVGTIAFWMNADAVENWRTALSTSYASWDDNIRFLVDSRGGLQMGALGLEAGTAGYFTHSLQPATWYHVALAWDATEVYGFLDGVLAFNNIQPDSASSWRGSTLTFDNVAVGNGYSTESERYWKGMVDEVRIYDRVLSADEISQLAAIPVPATPWLLAIGAGVLARRARSGRDQTLPSVATSGGPV